MSSHLNRRTALIAAGQGMAVLLLAACGKAVGQNSTPAGSTTARSSAAAPAPVTQARPPVTVPGLAPVSSSVSSAVPSASSPSSMAGTRLSLTPVTTTTAHVTTTVPTHTTSSVPTTPATHSSTADPTTSRSTAASTTEVTTSTSKTPVPTVPSRTTAASSSKASRPGLAGKVVAIDPGHNGGNDSHPEIINQLIDGGYGQRHVCNTTGTETNAGYSEHEFTWHVATFLRPMLEAKGIKVVMTRFNDTGVGPCTDKRAFTENDADADAVVSIHGDGAPAEVEGFYVTTATRPPAGATVGKASLRLASCIAQGVSGVGFPPSNTLGHKGLWTRDDLTGLNRSTRPKILIECGNMRNATEAGLMSSTAGQKRYAQGLANGVFTFLQGGGSSS